ncbi:unnamed protein product [Schistosoma turkestanicum]|nr:unnamed protein product [Schistosoma turkestanicum]
MILKLKPVVFLPKDYICRKGEVGKEMYIVKSGAVEVVGGPNNSIVFVTLKEGSVFGEISLLALSGKNRRTADVRSKGFSTLFSLSKQDFEEIMKNYPQAHELLKKRSQRMLNRDKKKATNEAVKVKKKLHKEKSHELHDGDDDDDNDNEAIIEIIPERPATPKLIETVVKVIESAYPEKTIAKRLMGSFSSDVGVIRRKSIYTIKPSVNASANMKSSILTKNEDDAINCNAKSCLSSLIIVILVFLSCFHFLTYLDGCAKRECRFGAICEEWFSKDSDQFIGVCVCPTLMDMARNHMCNMNSGTICTINGLFYLNECVMLHQACLKQTELKRMNLNVFSRILSQNDCSQLIEKTSSAAAAASIPTAASNDQLPINNINKQFTSNRNPASSIQIRKNSHHPKTDENPQHDSPQSNHLTSLEFINSIQNNPYKCSIKICSNELNPICDLDGTVYQNECCLKKYTCQKFGSDKLSRIIPCNSTLQSKFYIISKKLNHMH